jgi:hypothetical protein
VNHMYAISSLSFEGDRTLEIRTTPQVPRPPSGTVILVSQWNNPKIAANCKQLSLPSEILPSPSANNVVVQ